MDAEQLIEQCALLNQYDQIGNNTAFDRIYQEIAPFVRYDEELEVYRPATPVELAEVGMPLMAS